MSVYTAQSMWLCYVIYCNEGWPFCAAAVDKN